MPIRRTYQDGFDAGYAAGHDQGVIYGYWSGYQIGFSATIGYGDGRDAYESGYDQGQAEAEPALDAGYNHGIAIIEPLSSQIAALDGFECGYANGFNDGYSERFDAGETEGESDAREFTDASDLDRRYEKGREIGFRVWSAQEFDDGFRFAFEHIAGHLMSFCRALSARYLRLL